MKFQMFKMVLEKAEEPEIKLSISAGSLKKQEGSRKTSISAFDYAKAFDCVDHSTLLMGRPTGAVKMGNSMEIPQKKQKRELLYDTAVLLLCIYP